MPTTSLLVDAPPDPTRCGLHAPPTGQLLLGSDKRNPFLALYEDDSGERLLVFFGFELMETLPNDPAAPACKLLLGRLYNAGVKLAALCETFGVDPKTVRRWGQALSRGDPAELIRVLEGRGARRKRTTEVENFARFRWPELVARGSYGAVGRLQREIQAVFGVALSRSGLHSLIRELKAAPLPSEAPPETAVPENATPAPDPAASGGAPPAEARAEASPGAGLENGETTVRCPAEGSADPVSVAAASPGLPPPAPPPPNDNAHSTPFFPQDPHPANYWCDHAGVLIFAAALAAVSRVAATTQTILAQWLAALWLGAQNIEQTKFLNWADLELVLGGVVRFPTPQRQELKVLATDPGVIDGLWRFNQKNLGPDAGADFYFDPHTKHYTGDQNVLKGWCPKIRFADKVLHSDFIHTAQGAPIYFETTDNFADLRQRFRGVIGRARQALQWPADFVPTLVVDRGIYGQEFFEQVTGDPTFHLITWEKGFQAETWEPGNIMGRTTITRYRNSSSDGRTYRFEYLERAWKKNPKLRQIVVQATDPQGRMIQVAILLDDPKRAAVEAIRLIFQRWLQENDFKYLDKHFGINQITSYQSLDYAELKGRVEDREVKSAVRKALEVKLRQATATLKRGLLVEEQALQAHRGRAGQRLEWVAALATEADRDTAAAKALRRKLAALKTADARYEKTRVNRRAGLDQDHAKLVALQVQILSAQAVESRLDALIQAQMVKLDGQSKRLLDVLRISARNLFYQALQPFKAAYDNYRDDHDYFRQLTQSPGVLEVQPDQIVVHLMPRVQHGGELRKAVLQALETINARGLEHPCLPGKKLKFRLGQRSEMVVKMEVPP